MIALTPVLLWLALGPDCRSDCESLGGTDRQTCLLQCGQQDAPRDSGRTEWRREERLGGAPPGSAHEDESGTTTTVETINPDGTKSTTITTTSKRGTKVVTPAPAPPGAPASPRPSAVVARNAAAAGPWIVLAGCQSRCDADREPKRRATCKLACLDASPGIVRRVRTRP